MDTNEKEYAALIEEYKALKAEVNSQLTSSRQSTSLTLVALGAAAGSAKTIVDSADWILLFFPPVFLALLLIQLRYTYLALDMGTYINEVLAPRIQTLVESDVPMSWEFQKSTSTKTVPFLPIRGATLLVPWLGAMGSIFVYSIFHLYRFSATSEWRWGTVVGVIELIIVGCGTLYVYKAGMEAEGIRNMRQKPASQKRLDAGC